MPLCCVLMMCLEEKRAHILTLDVIDIYSSLVNADFLRSSCHDFSLYTSYIHTCDALQSHYNLLNILTVLYVTDYFDSLRSSTDKKPPIMNQSTKKPDRQILYLDLP